jgi:hypothetical protein
MISYTNFTEITTQAYFIWVCRERFGWVSVPHVPTRGEYRFGFE